MQNMIVFDVNAISSAIAYLGWDSISNQCLVIYQSNTSKAYIYDNAEKEDFLPPLLGETSIGKFAGSLKKLTPAIDCTVEINANSISLKDSANMEYIEKDIPVAQGTTARVAGRSGIDALLNQIRDGFIAPSFNLREFVQMPVVVTDADRPYAW